MIDETLHTDTMTHDKKKVGRPTLDEAKRLKETVSLRLKSDEVAMLREAAAANGKTFSSWVRSTLMDSAQKNKPEQPK